MGIFKTIGNAYGVFKHSKQVCCENLDDILNQAQLSIEESCKKSKLELKEKYKQMFEEFKNNAKEQKNYIDRQALDDYFFDNKISKKEYEIRNLLYKEKITQAIKDVDNNKISHKHFFDLIYNLE